MFTDLQLWLVPGPGLIITVTGTVCLVAAFIFLIKTLRDNLSADIPGVAPREIVREIVREVAVDRKPQEAADYSYPLESEYTEFLDAAVDVFVQTSYKDIEPAQHPAPNQRIKLMFDTAPLIIEYWDKSFNRIDYNQTAAIFYDKPPNADFITELDELTFLDGYQPDGTMNRDLWQDYLSKTLENGFSKFEYELQKNNKTVYLEVVARRIEVQGTYFVVTYTSDISAHKEVLHEKEQKAIAEAHSQTKSRFLAHMSHEIRTPISAVLGIAEIQLNRDHTQEAQEAFAQIYRSSSTLIGILNDVLDLSKIEAGKMEITVKQYDVAAMLQDIAQMHAVSLENKKFKFNIAVDAKLPCRLLGDELRIKQVINNLLSNSFKYTNEGIVQLVITVKPGSRPDTVNILATIEDTGCGMSPEQVNTLLNEDYVRFNQPETTQGTGLGISITQNLLVLMDAKMDITSQPGVGTKVSVAIPQQLVDDEVLGEEAAQRIELLETITPQLSTARAPIPNGRVMVVDDIASNLYVANGLLKLYELQVETYLSAIDAIESIKAGNTYDIIFMDHMMPEMDGIAAMQILRGLGYTKPIVALTANAFVDQEEHFLQSGFDAFLAKPIKSEQLYALLERYIINKPEADAVVGATDYYSSPEAFVMIKGEFLNTHSTIVSDVEVAIQSGNFDAAECLAHRSKNFALMLKESELAKVAGDIESKFRKKEHATGEMMQAYENEVNKVVERLRDPVMGL